MGRPAQLGPMRLYSWGLYSWGLYSWSPYSWGLVQVDPSGKPIRGEARNRIQMGYGE